MATKILIPTPLRSYTAKRDVVEAEGGTVGELLANMTAEYTELRKHLYTEEGKLRRWKSRLNADPWKGWRIGVCDARIFYYKTIPMKKNGLNCSMGKTC